MKRALDTNEDGTESPEKPPSPKQYATLRPFSLEEGVEEIDIFESCNPSIVAVLGSDVTEDCSVNEEIIGSVDESAEYGELNLVVEENDLPHNAGGIPGECDAEEVVVTESTEEHPAGEVELASSDKNSDSSQRTTKPPPKWQEGYVFNKTKEIKKTIIVHKPGKCNVGELGNPIKPSKTSTETDCCIIQTLMRRQFTQKSWMENDRKAIIRNGPPQPSIDRICLDSAEYTKFPWLSGCASENKVYCWYCLLYSTMGVWSTSANNLGLLIQAANKHGSTATHIEAQMLLRQWSLKAGIFRDVPESSGGEQKTKERAKSLGLLSGKQHKTKTARTHVDSPCLIVRLIKNSFIQGKWTEEERENIIERGRPTPKLESSMPVTNPNKQSSIVRNMNEVEYEYKKIPWLTGSKELGKLFCWPCVLFCPQGPWSKLGFGNSNLFTLGVHRHEILQNHLEACLRLKVWEYQVKSKAVDHKLPQQQHNEAVRRSREFMRYVVDVICYFKKKTTNADVSYGDAMKVIKKLSCHDAKLKHYLRTRSFFEDEISGITKAVEACLKNRIIKEANNANFVVLMLNRVCNKPWLSAVLRYVKKNGEVTERFLQFIDYKNDRTINNILQKVLDVIGFLNNETKLIGFTHDDSAFKPTDLAYFSSKITEKHPKATFFHYGDHNLKILVQHSLSQMEQCRTFIYSIQDIVKFFEQNPIAKTSLTIIDQEIATDDANSDYVWDFSSGLIKTINDHYPAMVKLFKRMIRSAVAWNTETVAQAQNFITFLQPLENRFLIATFSRILEDIDELTRVMKTEFNVQNWKRTAEKTTEAVIKTRCEDFEEIFQSAWNMVQSDQEYAYDIAYAEKFDQIMESVSIFIHGRTKDLDKWSHIELVVSPTVYEPGKSCQLKKTVEGLIRDFPDSGFGKLSTQLAFYKSNALFQGKTVDELIKYIHDLDMIQALASLHKFAQLLLTTPLYTTSSPQTPAIKKIAAYVNNRDNFTSTDTLMYLEKDLLAELQNEPDFYGDVINHFVKNSDGEHLKFQNSTEPH